MFFQIIDSNFLHRTDGLFFVLFLISFLPFSLVGLVCTIYGLKLSRKNNVQKKNIGYANLILGVIVLMGGISVFAFVFIVFI
jgi:uncharacterized SAM-binding protein YcdF (DUF218 family)